jgi:probable phosphomutase (TIGR03848 family)
MTYLLLIRHAENDMMSTRLAGRLPGVHLNDQGRQQTADLAEFLKDLPISAVYSSPLERAVETATPLAEVHGHPVQIRPALSDVDYGTRQGLTFRQLRRTKLWQQVEQCPSQVRFPGGETLIEVQHRVIKDLDTLFVNGSVSAVVTHADPIRLALAHYLGMALDDYRRLSIDTASVSVVQAVDGLVRVLHVNQTSNFKLP